jgi:hypothetical protein
MKNLALYPAASQTNRQGLAQFHGWLSEYLSASGPLVLFAERGGLFTEDGEQVWEEKPSDPILAFPLFRDGVQSVIFEPGVSEDEIRAFMGILLRFRSTTESDQDDVVTAMWEAALPSIKYTIADEFEAADPEFEVGALMAARPPDLTRPDIDAPWQAEAPMQAEGEAPVAKSIGSLFSLAESLDFTFAPEGAGGEGENLPGGQDGPPDAFEDWDEDGFAPYQDSGPGGGGGEPGSISRGAGPGGAGSFLPVNKTMKAPGSGGEGSGSGPGGGEGGGGGGSGPGAGDGSGSGPGGEAGDGSGPEGEAGGGSGPGGEAGGGSGGAEEGAFGPDGVQGASSGGPAGEGAAWADSAMGMDLSTLSLDDFEEAAGEHSMSARPEVDEELLAGRAERLRYWGLSPREIKQIAAFIQWDEQRAKSCSALSMIYLIIASPIFKSSMRPYLTAFAVEEIKEGLGSLSLPHANAFLEDLKRLASRRERRGARLIWDEVQKKLTDPELLGRMVEAIGSDQDLAPCYDSLRYFLYQLPPEAAPTLAALTGPAKSLSLKKLLLEVTAYFTTSQGGENLQKLVPSLNEWAAAELARLFLAMRRPLPIPVLTSLVKNPSAQVRELAARIILENEPENTQLLAPLAVDPDRRVRQLVTPAVTARRDPLVENVLLQHLSSLARLKKAPDGGDDALLPLYRALGHSASGRSLTFLGETLLRKDFKTLFEKGGDAHRLGAAVALQLMPQNSGAADILQKASRSAFRNIRYAFKESARLLRQSGELA